VQECVYQSQKPMKHVHQLKQRSDWNMVVRRLIVSSVVSMHLSESFVTMLWSIMSTCHDSQRLYLWVLCGLVGSTRTSGEIDNSIAVFTNLFRLPELSRRAQFWQSYSGNEKGDIFASQYIAVTVSVAIFL